MIETIRRMFELIDRAEWHRLCDFYSGDCVYDRPGYARIAGLPALEQFYREERQISSGKHSVIDHYERPDGIMVIGNFAGALRSGELVKLQFADNYHFATGLIQRRKTFFYAPLV